MTKERFRIIFIAILFAFFAVFLLKSFSPFGLKAIYNFSYPKSSFIKKTLGLVSVLDLGKIKNQEINYLELDGNKLSFTLAIPPSPRPPSKAKISVDFKSEREAKISLENSTSNQDKTRVLFEPILQELAWESVSQNGLTLYQKEKKYDNINSFLYDPKVTYSEGKGIGTYGYRIKPVITENTNGSFETNAILRGAHNIYVYVSNSNLRLDISKADLNQYKGSDSVDIICTQEDKIIFDETIKDDGINDDLGKKGETQKKSIDIATENGIYKISIDSGIDSALTNIKINQQLVVFDDLFLIDNPAVYAVADNYRANTIYTDADKIGITLGHDSQKQKVKINDSYFEINQKNQTVNLNQNPINQNSRDKKLNMIQTDINDIRIYSDSVFSFSQESFFKPWLNLATEISSSTDLDSLDYIIGKYNKATEKDGWYHQDLEIDIPEKLTESGELYFSIYTDDISTNKKNNWLKIKQLRITLE